jgi:hypothetical protein
MFVSRVRGYWECVFKRVYVTESVQKQMYMYVEEVYNIARIHTWIVLHSLS